MALYLARKRALAAKRHPTWRIELVRLHFFLSELYEYERRFKHKHEALNFDQTNVTLIDVNLQWGNSSMIFHEEKNQNQIGITYYLFIREKN